MKHKYDNAYKYIFSNKKIFYELITSFVDEDFVKKLNPEKITLLDKSFVSDEFLNRESDLIYKIKLEGNDAYIYFLLEFQSTVDKSIPVRMLLYILQFYDLLMRNSKKGKLPSVFPVLLYNGTANWTIPSNIKDLIDQQIPAHYIPSFQYYKIIEKDIPDEVLLQIKNLASAIIYLEKRKDEKGLKEAINSVIDLIKNEQIIDINMFTNWFKKMFKEKVDDKTIDKFKNIMEVKNMLTLVADKIEKKGYKKGIKEGIKEKAIETAKIMLKKNFSINDISEITGLSIEEINKLKF